MPVTQTPGQRAHSDHGHGVNGKKEPYILKISLQAVQRQIVGYTRMYKAIKQQKYRSGNRRKTDQLIQRKTFLFHSQRFFVRDGAFLNTGHEKGCQQNQNRRRCK